MKPSSYRPLTICAVLLFGCVQNAELPNEDEQQASFQSVLTSNDALREVFYSSQNATVLVVSGQTCESLEFVDGTLQIGPDAVAPTTIGIGSVVNEGINVATALHLVEEATEICVLGRGQNIQFNSAAAVAWCSAQHDLAVLALTTRAPHSFQWSEGTEVGEDVWTLGRMSPVGGSVTLLKPASSSEVVTVHSTLKLTRGDSGSPLINMAGRLIAVNSVGKLRGVFSPKVVGAVSSRPPASIRRGDIGSGCW